MELKEIIEEIEHDEARISILVELNDPGTAWKWGHVCGREQEQVFGLSQSALWEIALIPDSDVEVVAEVLKTGEHNEFAHERFDSRLAKYARRFFLRGVAAGVREKLISTGGLTVSPALANTEHSCLECAGKQVSEVGCLFGFDVVASRTSEDCIELRFCGSTVREAWDSRAFKRTATRAAERLGCRLRLKLDGTAEVLLPSRDVHSEGGDE